MSARVSLNLSPKRDPSTNNPPPGPLSSQESDPFESGVGTVTPPLHGAGGATKESAMTLKDLKDKHLRHKSGARVNVYEPLPEEVWEATEDTCQRLWEILLEIHCGAREGKITRWEPDFLCRHADDLYHSASSLNTSTEGLYPLSYNLLRLIVAAAQGEGRE